MKGRGPLDWRFLPVAASVLWAASGCTGSASLAREHRSLIQEGMSKGEVRQCLGEPFDVGRGDPPSFFETWVYVYGSTGEAMKAEWLKAFRTVVLVLGTIGTIAAVILRGGPSSISWNSSGSSSGTRSTSQVWRFSVRFGVDQRVVEITEVW
jgi:hypothetical protein